MSNIVEVQTKMGQPVLVFDGKYLASSYDAERDANRWASEVISQSRPGEALIVLGLGSGYHVIELERRCFDRPFIVVEVNPDLIEKVKDCIPGIPAKRIIHLNAKHALKNGKITALTASAFRTFRHPSSHIVNRDSFEQIYRTLSAREAKYLAQLLRKRGEMSELVSSLHARGEDLLDVTDIANFIQQKTLNLKKEHFVWLALRELVK